jgi:hypothetical protein
MLDKRSARTLRATLVALLSAGAVILAGCNTSDEATIGYVQVIHAVPDASNLRIDLDNLVLTSSLPYRGASGLNIELLDSKTQTLKLAAVTKLADNSSGPVLIEGDITMRQNYETTAIVTGWTDSVQIVEALNPRRKRPIDGLFFQFLHGASGTGPVDVYTAPPGTDLATTAPLATLAFGESTDSTQVPFENQVITITPAGSLDPLLTSDTLEFEDDLDQDGDGTEFVMSIIDSVTVGASPVRIIASTGVNALELTDSGDSAGLRVIQASPDTPVMDVVVGDGFDAPLASNLEYTGTSEMTAVPNGAVNLNFTVPGSTTEFLFEDQVQLPGGNEFNLYLIDDFENLRALTLATDRRSVATETRFRVVNAAPDSGRISIYVTDTADEELTNKNVLVRDLQFGFGTNYFRIAPDDYFLTITQKFVAEGENPDKADEVTIVGPDPISVAGGDVNSLVILPPGASGEAETFLLYDDLLP